MNLPAAEGLVGPLVMVDFAGRSPPPRVSHLIARRHLGGVVLFPKNVESAAQVAHLCRELQELARQAGAPPLVIAMDQEGGAVERLPLGLPGAMALGATGSAALAEEAGGLAGRALRAAGCAVNFAPVLDVNSNPENPVIGIRSFGEDPELVARLGCAFARGLRRAGVAATGKHFPGHGDADQDSHLDLPLVGHGLERLEALELLPFRRAVQQGLPALMTAHVAFTALSPLPATLCPPLLEGVLRRKWGFDGVVFTDALSMAAVRDHVGAGTAAVLALLAGADVLLALGEEDLQEEVFGAVDRALAEGVLSVARLRQSHQRLQRLRAAVCPPAGPAEGPAVGEAGAEEAGVDETTVRARAEEMAALAVTLVRRGPGTVPLPDGPVLVVTPAPGELPAGDAGPTLGEMLRELHRPARDLRLPLGAGWDGAPQERGIVILVTCSRGRPSPWHVELVRRAQQVHGDRLVLVATGTPYDLAATPTVSNYLVTYGREPVLLRAAARVLAGASPPRGRLPVTIPGLHPAGTGIVW
ncbi:MAG: beta-N-acetylhexosaminidase [Armatimonadota bacterium]|nr:beta-N-acetylhexosaminidase [Armatimonadota bacterium]MDR7469052.1 beta-N-acetylhexosaminidase [Armatimonadota bacterium]MDR7474254.1 beta-N-acetylhexosaminidase [Armatimonadota bacterium]MDR7538535.1 beta-N-acetylhexosaminidase [Armatimonadota bacterium]